MSAHALLSASGSGRWMLCPGSVSLEKELPDESSSYAAEGTAAHALAEKCLTRETPPENYLGEMIEGFEVTPEMAFYVANYVDYCNAKKGSEHFVELRINYSRYAPGGFGTADFITLDEGILSVIDLKYGTGVRVDAMENSQLMLYGLGAAEKFPFAEIDTVEMTVMQPRLDHISTYSLRLKDLVEWGKTIVKPAAERAMDFENPVFNPGDTQCRFCRAKPTCRALAKKLYETTLSKFDNLEEPLFVPTPHTINDEELAQLVMKADALIGWAQALKKQAHKRLMDGAKIGDFKLVRGRSSRQWIDEEVASEELKKLFGDQAFVTKLVSPAQAEKLDRKKKEVLQELIEKSEGAPTLAPGDDPRERLKPEVTFAAIETL
tara:strand:- start:581 stop:1714 length:1134 start_codon:yes stop_codon:yes gene_type:complete